MSKQSINCTITSSEHKEWKPSAYNFLLEDGDELILFNSITGINNALRVRHNRKDEIATYLSSERLNGDSNPVINMLVARGFLIDASCDEKAIREAIWNSIQSTSILRLILLPTEQCNFRCKYCYEGFNKGEMKPEVQRGIINYVRKNINRYTGIRVSWFGGEPLLAYGVLESLSKELIAICKNAKRRYISDITTNGYFLDSNMLKKLLKLHVSEYQITIDGTEEIHNSKKPLIDGGHTFERIVRNIKDIKDNIQTSLFRIVIRSNVTADSLESMDDFTAFFSELLGEDTRFSFFLRPAGDWGGNNRLHEMVPQRIKDSDIATVYKNFNRNKHTLRLDTHASFYNVGGCMCYAGFPNEFVIDSQGNLTKCTCELEDDFYRIGRIFPDGKMEIDSIKHAQWYGNLTRLSKKCQECSFSPVCFGLCCPKKNVYERRQDGDITCPSEKEYILDTLKFIEKSFPFESYG